MFHKQRKVFCAVLGDGMVGKTRLVRAFLGEKYSEKYVATTSDILYGSIIYEGEAYEMEIFDSAGERDPEVLSAPGIKESDIIVVCFNVQDRESFEGIRSFWIPEMKKLKTKAKVILVGLQSDNRHVSESVSLEEGEKLQWEVGADTFFMCSAKNNFNVKRVFTSVVDVTVKSRKAKLSFLRRALGR